MTDNVTYLKPKDPTAALRARRARARRKQKTVTIPIADPTTVTLENINGFNDSITVNRDSRSTSIRDAARRAAAVTGATTVTPRVTAPVYPSFESWPAQPGQLDEPAATRSRSAADWLAYLVAVGLAGIAAVFSIRGMVTIFPGSPVLVVVMASTMEAGKLVACGWLAASWRQVPWLFRGILVTLVAGLAVINAAGLFSQLTAAHVGNRALSAAAVGMEGAEYDARIEVAGDKVADLDRRLAAIDGIVAGAAQRGRAHSAEAVLEGQRKARAGLVSERDRANQDLADLKVKRASVQARTSVMESESTPLRYAAQLIGLGGDSEGAVRLLIALMVLCCDPLAIALTAAVSIGKKKERSL